MTKELKDKILAYNKAAAERNEKAADLDALVAAFAKLPIGQLRTILPDNVLAVLAKHGIE